jgi:hypothetical protein
VYSVGGYLKVNDFEAIIPKKLFYAASEWGESVSPIAPQSKSELELLRERGEEIVKGLPPIIVEYGQGYVTNSFLSIDIQLTV